MSSINSTTTTNAASVPNPSNSLDLSQFQSGATAQCIMALLQLQSELAEISNLYGEQVMSQLQASNAVAKGLANIEIQIGKDQMNAALSSGIGGMVSGVASGLAIVNPMSCELEKAPIQEKIDNARTYQAGLGNVTPEPIVADGAAPNAADAQAEALHKTAFNRLKTNTYERPLADSNEDQAVMGNLKVDEHEQLTKKVDKFISKQEDALERVQTQNDQKYNKWSQFTNMLASASRGAGDSGQGVVQKDLGKENAEKTYQSNALSQIQTAVSEAAKHADEYVGSAQQVSQILTDINRSNQMN